MHKVKNSSQPQSFVVKENSENSIRWSFTFHILPRLKFMSPVLDSLDIKEFESAMVTIREWSSGDFSESDRSSSDCLKRCREGTKSHPQSTLSLQSPHWRNDVSTKRTTTFLSLFKFYSRQIFLSACFLFPVTRLDTGTKVFFLQTLSSRCYCTPTLISAAYRTYASILNEERKKTVRYALFVTQINYELFSVTYTIFCYHIYIYIYL